MRNDGSELENLVADIEMAAAKEGLQVVVRRREYLSNGKPYAEFDIEVTGKVGTNRQYRGILQCRDRPSEGPQGADWIRELAGLRNEFNFSHIAAVSTTGFAETARVSAKKNGIELRTVTELGPDAILTWLDGDRHFFIVDTKMRDARAAVLIHDPSTSAESLAAFVKVVSQAKSMQPLLRPAGKGEMCSVNQAIACAISEETFDALVEGNERVTQRFVLQWPTENCYVVDTPAGEVRIAEIHCLVDLYLAEQKVPISSIKRYQHASDDGEVIAERAVYEFAVGDAKLNLELQMMPGDGTIIQLRRRT